MTRIFILTFEYGIYATDTLPAAEKFGYLLTAPSFGRLIPPIDFFNVDGIDELEEKLTALENKTGKKVMIDGHTAICLKNNSLPQTKRSDKPLSPNSNRLKAQLKYVGKYEPHHRTVEPRQDHISHQFNQNLELATARQQQKTEKLLTEDAVVAKILSIYKRDKSFLRNRFTIAMREAISYNATWRPRTTLANLLKQTGCKEDELALLTGSAYVYLLDELFKD